MVKYMVGRGRYGIDDRGLQGVLLESIGDHFDGVGRSQHT